MAAATANAQAGPSNIADTTRQRMRFPSPFDEYHTPPRIFASRTIELPRAKPSTRYPWPPKGRMISRHVDGDMIVTEYAQLKSNYLREYANDVIGERRQRVQRWLDLQERMKIHRLGSRRTSIFAAIAKKKVDDFMDRLTTLFSNDPPPKPARHQPAGGGDEEDNKQDEDNKQPSPARENKENEGEAEESGDESDDDESGDEGYVPSQTFTGLRVLISSSGPQLEEPPLKDKLRWVKQVAANGMLSTPQAT
jgi:hypothetical protein